MSASKRYEVVCTLTRSGNEEDITVSALVEYGPGFGGAWNGTVDGEVTALVGGTWVPLDALDLVVGEPVGGLDLDRLFDVRP